MGSLISGVIWYLGSMDCPFLDDFTDKIEWANDEYDNDYVEAFGLEWSLLR